MQCSNRGALAVAALLGLMSGVADAQGQGAVITGRVTGEQGQPLPGANVYIQEMNISVGTNPAGQYTISVAAARVRGQSVVMRVRSVGFTPDSRTLSITAGTQTVDFSLKADVNRLSEIVVTGVTGATERAKVPFSVARVDASEMPVVAVNPLRQLQGKVPGANISSNSGRPGTAPAVLLRGPTSINASGRSQEPLYIVDGVVLASGLPDINPNDIESVEVVKGAAAATLYGSRAGAGVIQITTKSGKGAATDGVRFGFRSEYGLNDVEGDFGISRNHTLLMDAAQQRFCVADAIGSARTCSRTMDYREEIARINNAPGDFALSAPSFPLDPGAVTSGDILRRAFVADAYPGKTYNAVDQLVDPKPISLGNLDMTGNFGNTNFFSSINYTQQGGAIQGLTGYERLGGRINLNHTVNDQWSVQMNSFFSRSTQDGLNQEEGGTGFFRLTRTPAIADITQRDTLGRLNIRTNLQAGGVQNENPLYSFDNTERQDVRYRYLGGATVKYTPFGWMDMEGNVSIDRLNLNFKQFNNRGFRTTNSNPSTNNGFLLDGSDNMQSINSWLQATIRHDLTSNIAGRFNLRTLYEQQDRDFRNLRGNTLRVSDVDAAPNITAGQDLRSGNNSTRQLSFSAGADLDMWDRYVLSGVIRQDGSSRFGSENRWQTYGRLSGSWLMARESWFPSEQVSQFTLRTSMGTAGNSPNFNAQYESYDIGSGGTLTRITLGNPDLRPEVITEWEFGTDIELFERYGLSLTYATSDSKDQILPVPVPAAVGFQTQWLNAGTMQNKTWEASLSLPFIRRPELSWSGRVNYTSNRARVTELNVAPFNIGTTLQGTGSIIRIEEGVRYGTFFGREFVTNCGQLPVAYQAQCGTPTSAFQRNDEGYVVWVGEGNNPGMGITDNLWNAQLAAADGPWGVGAAWGMPIVIRQDNGSAQQRELGHALPDYQLAFSSNLQWKGFTLFALLDGSYGQSVWNQGRHWALLDFLSGEVDQSGKSLDAAKPIGYYYRAPSPDAGGIGGFYDILGPNSRTVEDASYTKLRELSLTYRVGNKFGLGDWSVGVVGRNLFTWTDYTGFDPEVGVGGSGGESGSAIVNAIDAFTFPNLRSVTFVFSTNF